LYCFGSTFVTGGGVDFVGLNLAAELQIQLRALDALGLLTPPTGHSLS
jgi:hypothetical protein